MSEPAPKPAEADPLDWFMDRLVVHLAEFIRMKLRDGESAAPSDDPPPMTK
jgi:hypothetical protein